MSCASSSEKSDSEDSESDLSPPPFIHVPPSLVACLICSFVAASVAYFFTYSEKAMQKVTRGFGLTQSVWEIWLPGFTKNSYSDTGTSQGQMWHKQ